MSGKRPRRGGKAARPDAHAPRSAPRRISLHTKIAVGIAAGAVMLRLWGIGHSFPIITDEAIYLRWAEIIEHQGQWFISLLDGKPPLSYWLYALGRFVWDGDPLLATRSISAVAGGCTTLLLFGIGRRLVSPLAGLLAAFGYAVFPWSMVHDRLGLAEALVGMAGAAVMYLSLRAFESDENAVGRDIAVGLALGLALFIKTTAVLFVPAVAMAALIGAGAGRRYRFARLARVIAVAAVFPALTLVLTPEAPTLETTSALLHEASRFSEFGELTSDPLANLGKHWSRVAAVRNYMPWPALLFAVASLAYFTWKRSMAAWLFWAVCAAPCALQVLLLDSYASRYAYPHMWPWLLVLGVGLAAVHERSKQSFPARSTLIMGSAIALTLGALTVKSALILVDPQAHTSSHESGRYFGSYSHVGYGVPEAVELLRNEARAGGGFTLLTVPSWGVPADAFAAYLNRRDGIRVHEAWWLQMEEMQPLMPSGEAEIVRSHYERVSAGKLDFREISRVYFATDSQHLDQANVKLRQPGAKLLQSFPKPDGRSSIDVYRLK